MERGLAVYVRRSVYVNEDDFVLTIRRCDEWFCEKLRRTTRRNGRLSVIDLES
jgi:hypothetical protein